MYRFLVFIHVSSAFLFMLAHGATAAVMFKLRDERNLDQIGSLLGLRKWAEMPFTVSSTLMFLSGVALAFVGGWWRAGWIWASLGLFLVITLVMSFFGRMYLERVLALLEAPDAAAENPAQPDIEAVLSSGRPMFLALFGIGGFLAIVYLMMYKPF